MLRRLCRGCSATRARALALAAIRETYEETGLVVGEPDTPTLRSRSPAWADFLRHDANPRLDVLHYIARAITPPYRNRRFDARFFMVDAEHIQGEVHERPRDPLCLLCLPSVCGACIGANLPFHDASETRSLCGQMRGLLRVRF